MFKAGKTALAVFMGLLLSLTLLASGAFAQDTTTAQNATGASGRAVGLTVNVQQEAQQVLPVSSTQQLKAGQVGIWCGPYRCVHRPHYRHYARYGHFSRIRCRWFRRGWGRWSRVVRVCPRVRG